MWDVHFGCQARMLRKICRSLQVRSFFKWTIGFPSVFLNYWNCSVFQQLLLLANTVLQLVRIETVNLLIIRSVDVILFWVCNWKTNKHLLKLWLISAGCIAAQMQLWLGSFLFAKHVVCKNDCICQMWINFFESGMEICCEHNHL